MVVGIVGFKENGGGNMQEGAYYDSHDAGGGRFSHDQYFRNKGAERRHKGEDDEATEDEKTAEIGLKQKNDQGECRRGLM